MCQNKVELDPSLRRNFYQRYQAKGEGVDKLEEWKRSCYSSMLGWRVDSKLQCVLGGEQNQVAITHPVFNVGFIKAKEMMDWSYDQMGAK
jgi:hypothetical protein